MLTMTNSIPSIHTRPDQLSEVLSQILESGQVPYIHDQPEAGLRGVKEFAETHGFTLDVQTLNIMELSDIQGFPTLSSDEKITEWQAPDFLLPPWPYDRPHILLLNELSTARPEVQLVAYRLILNPSALPDHVRLIITGNGSEVDRVIGMGMTLSSRLVYLYVE